MEHLTCSATIIHPEVVESVAKKMLPEGIPLEMAEFFKMFGDETRLKILYSLSLNEMCVCDLSAVLQISQSAISHQLRVLKNSRLVKFRKAGKCVYYSLDDDHIAHILSQGIVHINEQRPGK